MLIYNFNIMASKLFLMGSKIQYNYGNVPCFYFVFFKPHILIPVLAWKVQSKQQHSRLNTNLTCTVVLILQILHPHTIVLVRSGPIWVGCVLFQAPLQQVGEKGKLERQIKIYSRSKTIVKSKKASLQSATLSAHKLRAYIKRI